MIGFSNDIINLIQILLVIPCILFLYTFWGRGIKHILHFDCHWSLYPLLGFIFDFFAFIIVETPCCILDISFNVCYWVHLIFQIAFSILVVIKKKNINIGLFLKKHTNDIFVILSMIITVSVIIHFRSVYFFDSDAQWNCGHVSTIISTDHIFRYDSESGMYVGLNNYSILFLAYLPYLSTLCKLFYIRPILMFYRVFSVVVISLYFCVMYAITNAIYDKNIKKISIAMVIIALLLVCPSMDQGTQWIVEGTTVTQSINIAIFSPMFIYLLIHYYRYRLENYWIVYYIVLFAGTFVNRTSGLSIGILLTIFFIPMLIMAIKRKRYIDIIKYGLGGIPAGISFIVTYFV